MPLSSKTSEAGWEYVNSQVSSQKGRSFPVGAEMRSPELGSPTQHSPADRSKIVSEVQSDLQQIVQDADLDHQGGPSLPSSTDSVQHWTYGKSGERDARRATT